jgi:hypothetical protein
MMRYIDTERQPMESLEGKVAVVAGATRLIIETDDGYFSQLA